jgi:hypothetical protein
MARGVPRVALIVRDQFSSGLREGESGVRVGEAPRINIWRALPTFATSRFGGQEHNAIHHSSSTRKQERGAKVDGAPCRTRTCDLLVRSQTLYPTELRAREHVIISSRPRSWAPGPGNLYLTIPPARSSPRTSLRVPDPQTAIVPVESESARNVAMARIGCSLSVVLLRGESDVHDTRRRDDLHLRTQTFR